MGALLIFWRLSQSGTSGRSAQVGLGLLDEDDEGGDVVGGEGLHGGLGEAAGDHVGVVGGEHEVAELVRGEVAADAVGDDQDAVAALKLQVADAGALFEGGVVEVAIAQGGVCGGGQVGLGFVGADLWWRGAPVVGG